MKDFCNDDYLVTMSVKKISDQLKYINEKDDKKVD